MEPPTVTAPPPEAVPVYPSFQNGVYYRYHLCISPELTLRSTVVISALHKLDRRDLAGQRKSLVAAFFGAVSHACHGGPEPENLTGSVTHFLNRFAIALFEEGSFLHLTEPAREAAVSCLVALHRHRAATEWDALVHTAGTLIDLTSGVYRARFASVVKSFVLHQPDDGSVPAPVRDWYTQLEPQLSKSVTAAGLRALVELLRTELPTARTLVLACPKMLQCQELCRVLCMSAAVAALMSSEVRSIGTRTMPLVPVTQAELVAIGTYDLHVLGMSSREGKEVFLTQGSRLRCPTPMTLFGKTYAELDALYVAHKRTEPPPAPRSRPRPRAMAPSAVVPSPPAEAPDALDLVTVTSNLLGFKKCTALGTLKRAVGAIAENARVFVKLGETPEDCTFAKTCYNAMHTLGMTSVHMETVVVVYSAARWKAYFDSTSSNQNWVTRMLFTMRRYDQCAVTMQIATFFDGQRLTDAKTQHPDWVDHEASPRSFFQTFFFSKWAGVKDMGPFNLMINAQGEVLLCDITRAPTNTFLLYNRKGLATSYKLTEKKRYGQFQERALEFYQQHPEGCVEWIRRLKRALPAHPDLRSNLFHEETLAAQEGGVSDAYLHEMTDGPLVLPP